MPLSWTKLQRFSALINGVFIGVGLIFLIWGITDIAFPIGGIMNVAVFALMRIILGIISLSFGIGVEAVQWAKIEKELKSDVPVHPTSLETTAETTQTQTSSS
jgi:hypothetical protein